MFTFIIYNIPQCGITLSSFDSAGMAQAELS